LIELRSISKSFDKPVLRGVNLQVPEGCLYGLIGPGASGKSLLLKVITGLIEPDFGEVRVQGTNLRNLTELELYAFRSRFGMLFQNNALFDFMTVQQNVGFPLARLGHHDAAEIEARVKERLERVELGSFGERMPRNLSGGQQKRVGVARATITEAPIILYDEPAAGLDPVTSQKIFNLLRAEQQARGTTVIMVSSDLDRLLSVTDRIGMMLHGKLIFDGTTEEARQSQEPHVRQFVHGDPEGPL
jgi:phospholipid/cholesterol/gamma-HCH transport system ATP-binding protein